MKLIYKVFKEELHLVWKDIVFYGKLKHFVRAHKEVVPFLNLTKKQLLFMLGFSLLVVWKFLAMYADLSAVLFNERQYQRDQNGIVLGGNTIEGFNGNDELILMFHGWRDTPSLYEPVINEIDKEKYDYLSILLPYHGRSLQEFSAMDYDVMYRYVRNLVKLYSNKYDKIHILAHSIGATLIVQVMSEDYNKMDLSKLNINLIAPALNLPFLLHAPMYYLGKLLYPFQEYLYCATPTKTGEYLRYDVPIYSDFALSRSNPGCAAFAGADGLKYTDDPDKVRTGLGFDYISMQSTYKIWFQIFKATNMFNMIKNDFKIIAFKDDKVVNYKGLNEQCSQNSHCKFLPIEFGGHVGLYYFPKELLEQAFK